MIVLDSSFLIAFYNERDSQHAATTALMERFLANEWGTRLLLEYVFLEVMTVLLVRRDAQVAAKVGRILLDARELEFVPCSDFFPDTFAGFSSQSGTRLSFTDAAIVLCARSRADGLVLTFDHEFRRLDGIRTLPEY